MIKVEEVIREYHRCPKCGGRVERRVAREQQQKEKGKYYVENCEECDYWKSGFC